MSCKLWRAYYHYADYEYSGDTVIGVFMTRSDADEGVLKWYEAQESKTEHSFGVSYDKMENVTIDEFELGELWELY